MSSIYVKARTMLRSLKTGIGTIHLAVATLLARYFRAHSIRSCFLCWVFVVVPSPHLAARSRLND